MSCNKFSVEKIVDRVTIYDAEGKLLTDRKGGCNDILDAGDCHTGSLLYKASDVKDGEDWKILYQLEYRQSSGSLPPNESLGVNPRIHSDYLKLFETSNNADVTFLVKNTRIQAHKLVLSTRSKYFERMFDSPLRENESNEIVVPDVEPNVFKAMLEFLYSGLPPRNLTDVSLELLTVADKYGMEELAIISETSALENLGAHNVVDSLLIGEMINNEKLMARSKEVFKECRDSVKQSEEAIEKLKSSPSLLIDLLFHFRE